MNAFLSNRRKQYKYNRKLGMSISNAAIAAGFPKSLVEKHKDSKSFPLTPNNTTDFFALFEQKQMTDMKKVERVLDGMNATKVVSLETDQKTSRGQIVYVEREVPDWVARHKWFETMLRLCKQLEKTENTNNVLVLQGDFAEQLRRARERATEEMKARYVRDDEETIDIPSAPSARDLVTAGR